MASPLGEPGSPPPDLPVVRPRRFSKLGPFVALLVPLTVAVLSLLILTAWPCSGRSCIEPHLGGWLLMLFAVPTAIAVGVPWYINPLNITLALVTSTALWMTLGAIAGRRADRVFDAGWGALAAEILTICAGVFAGVLLGFGLIALYLRF